MAQVSCKDQPKKVHLIVDFSDTLFVTSHIWKQFSTRQFLEQNNSEGKHSLDFLRWFWRGVAIMSWDGALITDSTRHRSVKVQFE